MLSLVSNHNLSICVRHRYSNPLNSLINAANHFKFDYFHHHHHEHRQPPSIILSETTTFFNFIALIQFQNAHLNKLMMLITC